MCFIVEGRAGACDRYANRGGELVRLDPLVIMDRTISTGGDLVQFLDSDEAWQGELVADENKFVTAIGAGTTYPDYKPAPFIVASEIDGVDMVTVVSEGIFSYCGVQSEDRHGSSFRRGTLAGPGGRGAGGPCHHGRIWFANVVAWRCESLDRRLEE